MLAATAFVAFARFRLAWIAHLTSALGVDVPDLREVIAAWAARSTRRSGNAITLGPTARERTQIRAHLVTSGSSAARLLELLGDAEVAVDFPTASSIE